MGTGADTITLVEARVRLAERWVTITEPRALAERCLDGWRVDPRLRCCSFQGGFFIDVNGQPWSDDGTLDEFPMTMCWFEALAALMEGASTFGPAYGPWEESRLTWTRDGDLLWMEDIHYSGGVSMRLVGVAFSEFVERFLPAARVFTDFLGHVQELAVALPDSKAREVIRTNTPATDARAFLDRLERGIRR